MLRKQQIRIVFITCFAICALVVLAFVVIACSQETKQPQVKPQTVEELQKTVDEAGTDLARNKNYIAASILVKAYLQQFSIEVEKDVALAEKQVKDREEQIKSLHDQISGLKNPKKKMTPP